MKVMKILNFMGSVSISLFGVWLIMQSWYTLQVPACDKDFCSVLLTEHRPLIYAGLIVGFFIFMFGVFDLFKQLSETKD